MLTLNDMGVEIDRYLYESENADYPNINRSGSDSELSSDFDEILPSF